MSLGKRTGGSRWGVGNKDEFDRGNKVRNSKS